MFDFSQHRWRADCRELSNDERNQFLAALEMALPDLRWVSGHKPMCFCISSNYLYRSTTNGCLTEGYFESYFESSTATASDIREFIAATLGSPAAPDQVATTLAQRGERYGEFDEFASISQQLKNTAHNAPKWAAIPDDCREAVDMILHKIARALNGDPNYADNWHDIQGYAKLVEQRITGEAK